MGDYYLGEIVGYEQSPTGTSVLDFPANQMSPSLHVIVPFISGTDQHDKS